MQGECGLTFPLFDEYQSLGIFAVLMHRMCDAPWLFAGPFHMLLADCECRQVLTVLNGDAAKNNDHCFFSIVSEVTFFATIRAWG